MSALTAYERLQDLALTHWGEPVDEALEPHLHPRPYADYPGGFRSIAVRRTLAQLPAPKPVQAAIIHLMDDFYPCRSPLEWPAGFCEALMHLIPKTTKAEANALLTRAMARRACKQGGEDVCVDEEMIVSATLHVEWG